MNTMQRAWRYLIAGPFIWMFLVFFQPRRFDREMEQKGRWRCFVLLLRMVVPMFLIAYPICLLGKVVLVLLHLELYLNIVTHGSLIFWAVRKNYPTLRGVSNKIGTKAL